MWGGLMETNEGRRCYAAADADMQIGILIWGEMQRQKISHWKLARRAKITTKRLHEILGGASTETKLEVLSNLFFALGLRMVITSDRQFQYGDGLGRLNRKGKRKP